ncbi:AI-2E family transporter [soil metagenome]
MHDSLQLLRQSAVTHMNEGVILSPGGAAQGAQTLRRLVYVIGIAILLGVLPFLSGLLGALMLYVMVRPLHERLAQRVPPSVAALAITFCVIVLILLPGIWLVSTIITEGSDFLGSLKADAVVAWLDATTIGKFNLGGELAGVARGMTAMIPTRVVTLFGNVSSAVLNVVIALFGLYYLLLGGSALWRRLVPLFPGGGHLADLLAARFATVTEALLLGTALAAALQGLVVGVGFEIVGLHPPVLWGFITACVSILPLFGSAIVWLPGVVILLLDHRPGAATLLLIVGGGLASNIDNLARILVFRRVSGIHPMITLVGAFAGLRLFGLIGVFLGPLVISYLFELLAEYEATTRGA